MCVPRGGAKNCKVDKLIRQTICDIVEENCQAILRQIKIELESFVPSKTKDYNCHHYENIGWSVLHNQKANTVVSTETRSPTYDTDHPQVHPDAYDRHPTQVSARTSDEPCITHHPCTNPAQHSHLTLQNIPARSDRGPKHSAESRPHHCTHTLPQTSHIRRITINPSSSNLISPLIQTKS